MLYLLLQADTYLFLGILLEDRVAGRDVDIHHGINSSVGERRLDRVLRVRIPDLSHVAELSKTLRDDHSIDLQDWQLVVRSG